MYTKDNNQKGIAMLLTVIVLSVVFVVISVAIARSNLIGFRSVELVKNSRASFYLAESGLEDTLIQLEDNISYGGNPLGEVTPIGTYYSSIDKLGDQYDISGWGEVNGTYRRVNVNITLSYNIPDVTTKAAFMADFFYMSGEGARIRGDVWTNDDFVIGAQAILEGNLASIGKGSHAVNWVWDELNGGNPAIDGGKILDNPDTTDVVEGNLFGFDTLWISGSGSYVEGDAVSNDDVHVIFGGSVGGTITENAGIDTEDIPIPIFDFDTYRQLAVTSGTYFNNQNDFGNYLESIDDGNERRLTDDIYYVKNGAVKIYPGSPVYLDGLLVVEDNLYIYCEWHHNEVNGLPAIVAGKDVKIENNFDFAEWDYDQAGIVRINGIVFAEKRIALERNFNNEDIIIDGAVWAGDDLFVGKHSFINYNLDPVEIDGFGFVTGISDLQINYWEEVI